ncbi:MAG: DnaD domain protein [Clostridia bacterium]|nr:DnaD domain protein [Clostridia bacterium]
MPGKEFPVDNITARFGADLICEGSTVVPNLLLKYYKQLGVSDREVVLFIQILFLRNSERDFYPTPEKLSQLMTASCEEIKEMLALLFEKRFLHIDKRYVQELDEIRDSYSLAPLMEELSCLWAVEKQQALLEIQQHLQNDRSVELTKVCKDFERQFGRLLSPVEVDQIRFWVIESEIAPALILEALRRAILMGVQNLKYVDKILLEWQKLNLATLEAVQDYESGRFQKVVKAPKAKKAAEKSEEKHDDKFRLLHWGNMGGSA